LLTHTALMCVKGLLSHAHRPTLVYFSAVAALVFLSAVWFREEIYRPHFLFL